VKIFTYGMTAVLSGEIVSLEIILTITAYFTLSAPLFAVDLRKHNRKIGKCKEKKNTNLIKAIVSMVRFSNALTINEISPWKILQVWI
jgi:hypothetical protein